MAEAAAEADIPLKCHVVDATISTAMYRYFRPVLLHVRSRGQEGATPESLSKDLFEGMEPVSRRLLEICADEGMVERAGGSDAFVISERGSDAIDDGRVLARDTRRMWKIYHTECELVPALHRVLMLDTGSDEAAYQKDDGSSMEYISGGMDDLAGRIMTPVLGKNAAPFRIERFNARYEKMVRANVRVRLGLRLARDGVWLDLAAYEDNRRVGSGSIKSGETYGDVVESLLDCKYGYDGRWDGDACRLEVRFDETSPEERASMKRDMVFERPSIYGCQFDRDIRMRVDIYPEAEYDAGKWARWLVGRKIGGVLGRDGYKKIKNDVNETFPEFDLDLEDGIVQYFEDN